MNFKLNLESFIRDERARKFLLELECIGTRQTNCRKNFNAIIIRLNSKKSFDIFVECMISLFFLQWCKKKDFVTGSQDRFKDHLQPFFLSFLPTLHYFSSLKIKILSILHVQHQPKKNNDQHEY